MQRKEQSRYSEFLESIHEDIKSVLLRESPLTPSAISKKTGYNWRTVKRHLDLLESEGLVREQRVGHIFIYTIQREGAFQ